MVKEFFRKFLSLFRIKETPQDKATKILLDIYDIIENSKTDCTKTIIIPTGDLDPEVAEIVFAQLEADNSIVVVEYESFATVYWKR